MTEVGDIDIEKWKEHFIKLYEASEIKLIDIESEKLEDENKVDIKELEVESQIRKLKNRKSLGDDDIRNKAWKNSNDRQKKDY